MYVRSISFWVICISLFIIRIIASNTGCTFWLYSPARQRTMPTVDCGHFTNSKCFVKLSRICSAYDIAEVWLLTDWGTPCIEAASYSQYIRTHTHSHCIHMDKINPYLCVYGHTLYISIHPETALTIADEDTDANGDVFHVCPAQCGLWFICCVCGVCVCVWCVWCVCVCFESCCFIIDYGFEVVLAMTSSLHSLSVFHKFKLLIF